MNTVRDILKVKGQDVWTIAPDASVYEALKLMAEKNVGALIVTKGEQIVGIMSERDYARKVILKHKLSKDTLVSEIMTARVLYVRPEQTIEECMALMSDKHIRHLPVLEDDRLVGLVSIGDLVRSTISEQAFIIQQLQNYIVGGPNTP